MADLFSRSFHCLWVRCPNLLSKPSERLRISSPIPLHRRWLSVTHHTHMLPNSTSSSSSLRDEDVDILSLTQCSDGSFLFRFGNASEIREKIGKLDQEKLVPEGVEEGGVRALLSDSIEKLTNEVDHNLGEEIESSSTVVVGVADQKPQPPMNEKESVVVLDDDPETPVINDSQEKTDRRLKLDSVEDAGGQHAILSEDAVSVPERNVVPNVSEEDSQVDSHKEVVVSSVSPESDLLPDLSSGASGEVEEKEADKGHGVDGATNSVTGGVDADLSELVPASTSLESEHSANRVTNKTGGVDADLSELVPVSTSLESEQVVYSATDNLTGSVDADISESVSVSTSSESEQVVYSETDNLARDVDADLSESVPLSTSSESEQVVYSAIGNLTGGVDADLSELVPVSTSSESEFHAHDEEAAHHIVDDSVDASEMGMSAVLHDLVPSSDLENKINVGNSERSDYENPSHIIVPEIHSVEMASHGEKTSRAELFLVSGAAFLPHPSKALTGREDAYFISHQNWLAVADGVGQWSLEGSNSGLYIRELMGKCENIVSNYENISTIKPAEVLARSAAETQSPGSSSVLVAYFDGQALHAANVGNTGFIIIRDSSIFKKSTALFHEFSFPLQIVKGDDPSEIIEEYKIDLNDGDVIVFATNGLFDNLYGQEIASITSKSLQASLRPQEIAEFLAMRAQEVGRSTSTRSPFGDEAQAVGYVGYTGGKLDDVTVIVSLVQTT